MHNKKPSTLIPSESRRKFILTLPFLLASLPASAAPREFVGAYSDEQLVALKGLTFPRLHLYNQAGKLVDQKHWPRELRLVKKHAGEAFCCVSDKPAPPGSLGPPPDCKRIVYGEDVSAHFAGLLTTSGSLIRYSDLPRHKYLVVEYFADWCSPCIPARRALESFLKSPSGKDYVAVVVDFSRLPKAQEFAQQLSKIK
jgi:hypothetical protein